MASDEYQRGFDAGFGAVEDWLQDLNDTELAGRGLMRAPVDKNGRTWRVGDLLQSGSVVVSLTLDGKGWSLYAGDGITYKPSQMEHMHSPADRAREANRQLSKAVELLRTHDGSVGSAIDWIREAIDEIAEVADDIEA